MRSVAIVGLTLAAAALPAARPLGAAPPLSSAPQPPSRQLLDRIVAIVDEDPILLSEVEQVVELGLAEAEPGESGRSLRRRVLDGLIEQRVRFHEIDRFGTAGVRAADVERQFEAVRAGFESAADFQARLLAVGLDEQGLRQLLARQVIVLTYVEERLGPRVFVGLEDIRAYYDTVLTPELAAAGETAPPLDEVRQEIRALLREQRLNEEIDRWTEALRREADVVDLFDVSHDDLPPVVATSEE